LVAGGAGGAATLVFGTVAGAVTVTLVFGAVVGDSTLEVLLGTFVVG